MKKIFTIILVSLCLINGCRQQKKSAPDQTARSRQVFTATYTQVPVVMDGKLDDPVWKQARVYKMQLAQEQIEKKKVLQEAGQVQLAWDDQYFYVGIKYCDSDIVAEGQKDQLHHYSLGDVGEVFLKPEDCSWYWELYVTPTGKKTSFWFPGRGRLGLPSCFEYSCGLKVAAQVCGTLNHWQDRDEYWTGEIAMPIKDLTAQGAKFGPGTHWRILIARYNYSRYLATPGPELSMTPSLRAVNYHLHEDYAVLRLEK